MKTIEHDITLSVGVGRQEDVLNKANLVKFAHLQTEDLAYQGDLFLDMQTGSLIIMDVAYKGVITGDMALSSIGPYAMGVFNGLVKAINEKRG